MSNRAAVVQDIKGEAPYEGPDETRLEADGDRDNDPEDEN